MELHPSCLYLFGALIRGFAGSNTGLRRPPTTTPGPSPGAVKCCFTRLVYVKEGLDVEVKSPSLTGVYIQIYTYIEDVDRRYKIKIN